MGRYKLVGSFTHNGKEHKPGETVELTDEQVKAMPWLIGEVGAPPSASELAEAQAGEAIAHEEEHHRRKR